VSWAVAWTGVGAILYLINGGMVSPTLSVELIGFSFLGFVGGSLFAAGFTLTEGRRRLDELTLRRAALWGAIAGVVGPLSAMAASGVFNYGFGIADVWQLLVGTLVAGGLSGTAMTAIARAGESERFGSASENSRIGGPFSGP
jgi:hypothetical protein